MIRDKLIVYQDKHIKVFELDMSNKFGWENF